jgi:hypothetical protein
LIINNLRLSVLAVKETKATLKMPLFPPIMKTTFLPKFVCTIFILFVGICLSGCQYQSQSGYTSLNGRFRLLPGRIIKAYNEKKGYSRSCFVYIVPEQDVTLRLKLISVNRSFPAGWDLFFSDNNGYHLNLPDSSILTPVTIKSAENDLTLGLMVNTNGIPGKGLFEMTLEEIGHPGKDTLRFEVE